MITIRTMAEYYKALALMMPTPLARATFITVAHCGYEYAEA